MVFGGVQCTGDIFVVNHSIDSILTKQKSGANFPKLITHLWDKFDINKYVNPMIEPYDESNEQCICPNFLLVLLAIQSYQHDRPISKMFFANQNSN